MAQNAYKVTEMFEEAVAKYCGSPYAIAVDSCTSALMLAVNYVGVKGIEISIPERTYMSLPCLIIQASGKVTFEHVEGTTITGEYRLKPTNVWDSALKFSKGMFVPGRIQCLSFSGPNKILKLGKGGMILTDSFAAMKWFKKARFSGRNEISYHEDTFDMLGWNVYMLPEIAARGLLLMNQFYNLDGTPKENKDLELPYPDLSQFKIYNT